MKPLVILKAGDTFPDLIEPFNDFETWIETGLELGTRPVEVVDARTAETLPAPGQIQGAVISGSHAYVTDGLDWSLKLEAWTRELVRCRVPVLGICYGHQILGKALGGTVDFHPVSLEIGTRDIALTRSATGDPLFQGLPRQFKAHVFHSQSVTVLPPEAILLAKNSFEPHQAFRVGDNAWGVQFHPEAFAAITKGYIQHLEADVRASGQDPDTLIDQLEETPFAASILKRFSSLVSGYRQ